MNLSRKFSQILLCLFLTAAFISCKQNPKELGTSPVKVRTGIEDAHKNIIMDVHQIKVEEAYPTSKYLYLRVKEGDRAYWLATRNSEVKVGEVYYYNEALVRANFESKEMERVFDTLYLVTQLVSEAHGAAMKPKEKIALPPKLGDSKSKMEEFHTNGNYRDATEVTLGELLSNPEKLEGKMVEIQGVCLKINTGILGRNWIHVQDQNDSEKKVVVTSQWEASPGDEIKVRALVALNKDFGAGYTYDVILEEGILVR